ncbi:MAG: hypothetical protein CMJ78_09820 [Planctomycetaceae bacterium]|nr:hypothetical protein [Planctomycetaceae bacterium]
MRGGARVVQSSRSRHLAVFIPLLIYVGCVIPCAVSLQDQLNGDAISYIRNGLYITEGRFVDSISGYWSPLISWLIVPWLAAGFDQLIAARVTVAITGFLLVLASWFLLHRMFPVSSIRSKVISTSLIALFSTYWCCHIITPDILLTACVFVYLGHAIEEELVKSPKRAFRIGIIGGICYLAKSYAFPFFLAHFTASIALRWWVEREESRLSLAAKSWCAGMAGFALIAGLWVGTLSWKYEKLTISTVGPIAHAIVGPGNQERYYSPYSRLQRPLPGRIMAAEVPETQDYLLWSPFESTDNLIHQIKLTLGTAKRFIADLSTFDAFSLSMMSLCVVPLITMQRNDQEASFRYFWTLMTAGIYGGGFLMVAYVARYIETFFWPFLCVVTFGVAFEAIREWFRFRRLPSWQLWLATSLVVISFLEPAVDRVRKCFHGRGYQDVLVQGELRRVAKEMAGTDLNGPVAASTDLRYQGMAIAFHLNSPYLGASDQPDVNALHDKLRELEASIFILSPDWEMADEFRSKTNWQLHREYQYAGRKMEVYKSPGDDVIAKSDMKSREKGSSGK